TSCGHRGVVNAVKQAMTVSGLQKVHAVLGGFHLAPHNEDYVRQTIKGLVDLDVDHIVPMHCTGEPFYEILKAELPKKVIRSYTGTKLVFGDESSPLFLGPRKFRSRKALGIEAPDTGLQRKSPFLAPCVVPLRRTIMAAIRAERTLD